MVSQPSAQSHNEPATQNAPFSKVRKRLLFIALAFALVVALILNMRYYRDREPRLHIQRGIQALENHRPNDAEQEFRTALQMRPDMPDSYRLLTRLYMDSQQPKRAIPLFERLRTLAPETEHLSCGIAEAYALAGDDKKVMDAARQAVLVEPNCAQAHTLLGLAYGNQLETKKAIEELSKAKELAPENNKIAISLAQAYLDSSDLTHAEQIARSVIARDPNYPTAYYTLGRSYSARTPTPENLKEGITAFEKAIQLKPEWGDAFSELGRLRLQAGDVKGAISALEYLWKRGVKTEESTFSLANAYRKAGKPERAAEVTQEFKRLSDFYAKYDALRKRLALHPLDTNIALEVAECEVELKNWSDAQLLLEGILKERPNDVRALKAIIKLYAGMGNKGLAEAYRARLSVIDKGDHPKP